MRKFLVIGSKALTTPEFNLSDMPGSAGRMDILCRCVNSAFFLSHDLRRDTILYLLLLGEPNPPVTIKLVGSEMKYLNPDERSAGSLIQKALALDLTEWWRQSTPGVYARKADFGEVLDEECEKGVVYLHEDGEDVRNIGYNELDDRLLILGDHTGLHADYEAIMKEYSVLKVSLGQVSLHADHCIIIVHNELDRKAGSGVL